MADQQNNPEKDLKEPLPDHKCIVASIHLKNADTDDDLKTRAKKIISILQNEELITKKKDDDVNPLSVA